MRGNSQKISFRLCETRLHGRASRHHNARMGHSKTKKELFDMVRAGVEKEMRKPRMARSATVTERNLTGVQAPEEPSTIMSGTVDRIIPSPGLRQPERAQITIESADGGYRELRIENSLTDRNGDEVTLKKGAHVEITVRSTKIKPRE
jgi:hypothetical protein